MSTTPLPYYISAPGTNEAPPMAAPVNLRSQIAALPNTSTLAAPSLSSLNLGGGAPAVSAPPLMPQVTMSRSVASSPNSGDSQIVRDQTSLNNLRTTSSGVDQIHNPLLRGVAKIGDTALSIALPGLARKIPGTTERHDFLVGQAQQNLKNDQAQQTAQQQQQDIAAQEQERQAEAARKTAQGDADAPFVISPIQAAAAGHPELAGTQATMRDYNKLLESSDKNATTKDVATGNNQTKVTTTGMNNDTSKANTGANIAARESISDAANKTRTLVAQMHDATSAANNANTNNHKGLSGDGSYKVPADVTKRAALASNVIENANAVDSLIQQRPDIVGAAGGRYTSVQQMIGSDDPAIAEMGVRMHNIALASNGAHGVRSAQAINQTEDELFNHFKTGPNGIHAALNATRGSMSTFQNDEQNFAHTGQRVPAAPAGGAPSSAIKITRDASGRITGIE